MYVYLYYSISQVLLLMTSLWKQQEKRLRTISNIVM